MNWFQIADIELIPLAGIVVGFGLLVVLPVVAILTEHQRKMARILRGQMDADNPDSSPVIIGLHASVGGKKARALASNDAVLDEVRALRGEVAQLRLEVAAIQPGSATPPIESDVRERLAERSTN